MTKKLTINQKKFNKLVRALDGTWNCEQKNGCKCCPFYMNNSQRKSYLHCGALAIREQALQIFPNDIKIKECC